jgi:tRNA (guanine37-N1)-methyltransferase
MVYVVKVKAKDANETIKYLKEKKFVNNEYKISKNENYVFIPIIDKFNNKNEILDKFIVKNIELDKIEKSPKSLSDALKKINPNLTDEKYTKSYDQIGDIAIIDIDKDMIKYEKEIGMAILNSNKSVKTVFRKSKKVSGMLRLRGLSHIGGEYKTKTLHKEYGLNIVVDVENTYFSPRLATEHNRIANKIKENSEILDLFCSLAPFGFHIANDKNCHIDCIDINPIAIEMIKESLIKNKLVGSLNPICIDASEFLLKNNKKYDYIIMNHPSGAFDFLERVETKFEKGTTIFYYDFVKIKNYEKNIKEKLKTINFDIENIHIVRQSSPSEYHICVEGKLN